MIINLIRHGKTKGNLEKRYIGITDDELLEEEKSDLRKKVYPYCDKVYSSPMKRCIQTVSVLYPHMKPVVISDFRECDFGIFEGHNYVELSCEPLYQTWIDSGGNMDFPQGERISDFKNRVVKAFDSMISASQNTHDGVVSVVVHGGTIMAVLEHFEDSHEYYRWQCANGSGYVCDYKDGVITVKGVL